MKTKHWIILLGMVFLLSILGSWFALRGNSGTAYARITSGGKTVATVSLYVDQQFSVVTENGGENIITVCDGRIAVTEATCPDHYCMNRGFCAGGTDIVCLPNRLVIHFLREQNVDAAVG